MSKKVKVGIIGAGSWAVASHIPHFAARPEVELVVVNRLETDKVNQVKEMFGFKYATTDYKEVLEHDLDIVLVSSPPHVHYEHALAALNGGCHVLCEKPFTLTASDAWDLVKTAESRKKHLLLAFGWNYKQMVIKAKQLMDEGGVGNIEAVMLHMASPLRKLLTSSGSYHLSSDTFSPDSATWTDKSISGGGYAQAQLPHALGLSLWLTNLRGEEIFARMNNASAEVDMHDAYSLKYRNGAIGTVFGASNPFGASKHQLEVRIFGDDGQMVVDLERERVWLYRSPDDQIQLDIKADEGSYDCSGPVHTLIDLAQGKEVRNHSPGELGARVTEIIEASYLSAQSGKSEKIASHN